MAISDKEFIVYVAAYLYSLTNDWKDRDKQWHIKFFFNIYTKYINSKHEGYCTNKAYNCWLCFINKYIDLANTVINKESFDLYLEELKNDSILLIENK